MMSELNVCSILSGKVKRSIALLAGALFVLFSTPSVAGWEVQWIDKFEGNGVNWNNWTAQTNANYNNEVQCYTADDSSGERNYEVSEGTLKIIARKNPNNCSTLGGQYKTWTSGRLNSKDKQEFLYGRIESRIRFHNLEAGTWPAFWMLENRIMQQPVKGDNDLAFWPNPGAGEIDVWEWFSNNPDSYITNFFNTGSCGSEVRYSYPNGAQDVQDWHRYAIEWSEDHIEFFMDDTLVASNDMSNCSQYEEPMFVLLNVAMGGMLGGSIDPNLQTATMEVDYVAHCQSSDSSNAIYCNEDTLVSDSEPDGDEDMLGNDSEADSGEDVLGNDSDLDDDSESDKDSEPSTLQNPALTSGASGGSINGLLLLVMGLFSLTRRKSLFKQ